MEILERPDGRLLVECRGHLVQAQQVPNARDSCVSWGIAPSSTAVPTAPAVAAMNWHP